MNRRGAQVGKVKYDFNAILLAFYLYMFIILRVVWSFNAQYSTVVLGGFAIVFLVIRLFNSKTGNPSELMAGIGMVSFGWMLFVWSFFLDENPYLSTRAYEYIISGAIPIILMSGVRDFNLTLKTSVYLSIFVFLLYASDPFLGYQFSGGYMIYGYEAMVPAFFGIHIGRVRFGMKYLVLLELASVFLIFFFGNRMAIGSCLMFFLLVDALYRKHSSRKLLRYAITLVVGMTLLANIQPVLIFFSGVLSRFGLESYALAKALEGISSSFLSGRDVLWDSAISVFLKSPFIGSGIGYFEAKLGIYSHNVFLDILTSFGLVGFFVFLFLMGKSALVLLKTKGDLQLFGLFVLCVSFPKLLTSVYMFKEPTFWLFLFCGFFIPIRQNFIKMKLQRRKLRAEASVQ